MKVCLAAFLLATFSARFCSAGPRHWAGEEVYRDNCTRCHVAFQSIPARALPTVVHHMQVRALLPRDQQRAVLNYLLETVDAHNRPNTAAASEKKP